MHPYYKKRCENDGSLSRYCTAVFAVPEEEKKRFYSVFFPFPASDFLLQCKKAAEGKSKSRKKAAAISDCGSRSIIIPVLFGREADETAVFDFLIMFSLFVIQSHHHICLLSIAFRHHRYLSLRIHPVLCSVKYFHML